MKDKVREFKIILKRTRNAEVVDDVPLGETGIENLGR